MTPGSPAPTPAPAELIAQQQRLAALITLDNDNDGDSIVDAFADDAPAVAQVLRPLAGAPPRLAIYRNAYRGRLIEALRSNVPVLHRVLGDDDFATLALAYLADHPSREPSIRWFGHALGAWIDTRAEAGDEVVPHPALADLARMEWAIGTSFDSADRVPVAVADLASLAGEEWPGLRFEAHPSLRLVALHWAVEPAWKALSEDEDAQSGPPEPLDHVLAVWRDGLETRWRSLPADEHDALAACIDGMPFGALCERVAGALAAAGDAPEAAPGQVAGWLRGWVENGLLVLRQA
jgi:hypothetical protein